MIASSGRSGQTWDSSGVDSVSPPSSASSVLPNAGGVLLTSSVLPKAGGVLLTSSVLPNAGGVLLTSSVLPKAGSVLLTSSPRPKAVAEDPASGTPATGASASDTGGVTEANASPRPAL